MSRKQIEDLYESQPLITEHGVRTGDVYLHKQHGYSVIVGFVASMQDSTYREPGVVSGKRGQPPGAKLYVYRPTNFNDKPGLWARERKEFTDRFRSVLPEGSWLHMKTGGIYRVIGEAKVSFYHCAEGDPIVCYKPEGTDVDDGYTAIPLREFLTRFSKSGHVFGFNPEMKKFKAPDSPASPEQVLDKPVENMMVDEESKLFNKLTPEQHEAISMLLEEAGEIVQMCGKILRHGLYSIHPDNPNDPNYNMLSKECGDVTGVISKCIELGILSNATFTLAASQKMRKAAPYLHHLNVHPK